MEDCYLCGNFSAHNPKLEPLMLCLLKKKNSFTITKYFSPNLKLKYSRWFADSPYMPEFKRLLKYF